jgi:hypothetical protein
MRAADSHKTFILVNIMYIYVLYNSLEKENNYPNAN